MLIPHRVYVNIIPRKVYTNIVYTDELLGHPGFGASWEAFCVEAICSSKPDRRASFYRI